MFSPTNAPTFSVADAHAALDRYPYLAQYIAQHVPPTERVRILGPADVAAVVIPLLTGAQVEKLVVVVVDRSHRVLDVSVLSTGGSAHTVVDTVVILRHVLAHGGASFALAHNHPSGDPEPSTADLATTARVRDAASVVGLGFLDHVVVTDRHGYTSIVARGR